jgi:hypothetical protein
MPFLLPTMPTDALRLVLDAGGAACHLPVRATCRAFRDAAPVARRGDHAALVRTAARAGSASLMLWAVQEGRHPGPLACAAAAHAGQLPLLQALRAAHVAWDSRTHLAAAHDRVRAWAYFHGCPLPRMVLTKSDDFTPMFAADLPETVRAWAAPRVAALDVGGGVYKYVSSVGGRQLWHVQRRANGRLHFLGITQDKLLAAVLAAAHLADAHRLTSREAVHGWAWRVCYDPTAFDAWLDDPARVEALG